MVCSATATALAPGVFMTAMPVLVAASRSMLSTPTPARPITRSLFAARSTSAFTSTAERTMSASASDSAAGNPFVSWSEVMTVHPASSFRSCTALAAIFSAMTIFNLLLTSPRHCRRLHGFRVDLLCGAQTCAELDRAANVQQHLLQGADSGDGVEIIVITKMGYAEQLPLHLALAVGDHRAEVVAECLDDVTGINSVRRGNGRERGSGRLPGEQLQTKRQGCRSRHLGRGFGVVDQQLASFFQVPGALLAHIVERRAERRHQRR